MVKHKQWMVVGAHTFLGNPYDRHVLCAKLDQTANLLQVQMHAPTQVTLDFGHRGVDAVTQGCKSSTGANSSYCPG